MLVSLRSMLAGGSWKKVRMKVIFPDTDRIRGIIAFFLGMLSGSEGEGAVWRGYWTRSGGWGIPYALDFEPYG